MTYLIRETRGLLEAEPEPVLFKELKLVLLTTAEPLTELSFSELSRCMKVVELTSAMVMYDGAHQLDFFTFG